MIPRHYFDLKNKEIFKVLTQIFDVAQLSGYVRVMRAQLGVVLRAPTSSSSSSTSPGQGALSRLASNPYTTIPF